MSKVTISKGQKMAWFSSDGTMSRFGVYEVKKISATRVTLESNVHGKVHISPEELGKSLDLGIWKVVNTAN